MRITVFATTFLMATQFSPAFSQPVSEEEFELDAPQQRSSTGSGVRAALEEDGWEVDFGRELSREEVMALERAKSEVFACLASGGGVTCSEQAGNWVQAFVPQEQEVWSAEGLVLNERMTLPTETFGMALREAALGRQTFVAEGVEIDIGFAEISNFQKFEVRVPTLVKEPCGPSLFKMQCSVIEERVEQKYLPLEDTYQPYVRTRPVE